MTCTSREVVTIFCLPHQWGGACLATEEKQAEQASAGEHQKGSEGLQELGGLLVGCRSQGSWGLKNMKVPSLKASRAFAALSNVVF